METNLFIINLVTIAMLGAALFYGMRLSRQIQAFMKSRAELGALFRTFDRTIAEAREHMQKLRGAAEESEQKLRDSIDRANILADDLAGVADRAEKMFTVIERARIAKAPLTPPAGSKVTFEEDKNDDKPLTNEQRAKKQAILERMLQKVANSREAAGADSGDKPADALAKARSALPEGKKPAGRKISQSV